MAATSEPTQQPPIRKTLDFREIVCILVLRLQGPIQSKAAMSVTMKILESNSMLFPIYSSRDVKTVKKLL